LDDVLRLKLHVDLGIERWWGVNSLECILIGINWLSFLSYFLYISVGFFFGGEVSHLSESGSCLLLLPTRHFFPGLGRTHIQTLIEGFIPAREQAFFLFEKVYVSGPLQVSQVHSRVILFDEEAVRSSR
jgi:hypothetical protein